MLSIVPLMNGGGLFETGAGGSAPKHVQQLVENYLRWDSLGNSWRLCLAWSTFLGARQRPCPSACRGRRGHNTSWTRTESPTRRLGGIDNRGSHFYLALFWAEALASQTGSPELANVAQPFAQVLRNKETDIVQELIAQGTAVDLGGYCSPDVDKCRK